MHDDPESTAIRTRLASSSSVAVQSGRYRDIAALGRGGMGSVYLSLGSDAAGDSQVLVIKRLRSTLAADAEFLQMFLDEARTAARLRHPNVAQTHEVGFDGEHYFIAREYLDGQPLSELIRRASTTGGLPLSMQLRILVDALAGLHHAHEQKALDGSRLDIVHRDFSPTNIFVLYDGTVKVVDFGIAKTAYGGKTKVDIFKGKIQYVAPEQYASRPIDRRTDIYSAGVVLWEAATQRRMWSGLNDLAVAQRVTSADIPLPSSIEPGIPKRLEAICMRALAPRPEDRYPTAAHFRAELESFLAELGDAFSTDNVGRLVSELAADQRAETDALIAEQLRRWEQDTDPLSLAPTVTSPRTMIQDLSGGQWPLASARRSRSTMGLAASALLGILCGLVFILVARSPVSSGRTDGVAAPLSKVSSTSASALHVLPTHAATSPSAGSTSSKTHIRVETVPSSAQFGVDGSLLPPDTHDIVMPKDFAAHRLWAQAPGYQSKAEWVRLDGDEVLLRWTLLPNEAPRSVVRDSSSQPIRASAPGGAGRVVSPPASDATNAPVVLRVRTTAVRVQLDATDPWKN